MPFCTAVGSCSQHMRDYWRWFISFWSIGPEVDDVYVISSADVRLISEKMCEGLDRDTLKRAT